MNIISRVALKKLHLELGDLVVINGQVRIALHLSLPEALVLLAHASKLEPQLYAKVCDKTNYMFARVQLWDFARLYERKHCTPFAYYTE